MKRIYIILAVVVALSALLTVAYAHLSPGTMVVTNPQATTTPPVSAPVATTSITQNQNTGYGSYAYQCDEHVGMTLTPAKDLKTMAIKPVGGSYPPATTLTYIPAKTGVRYEGGGVVLTAHGETVTLGEGDSAINCSPAEMPDMAPFNFGD
ncbi:MAG: hypothetical protein JWN49_716 [Parcubacteria group bacterium]|nr:hypothetical protein [Parcubacteria group bacterium]